MRSKIIYLLGLLCIALLLSMQNSVASMSKIGTGEEEMPNLENPIDVEYLKEHLPDETPRLILNPQIERNLKQELKNDPVIKNMYKAIKLNAKEIQTKPLLERDLVGRRLLGTSREMLYRMNMLGMVYRMEKDQQVLERINEEVRAVCNFKDWNPSHFLDVAEMSMAVAFAIDWAGNDLPNSTVELAKTALIEKGIKPSFERDMGWITGNNNWNQVCHGGMVAAAIATAEKNPELAAKTISRALEGMPHALEVYGPDGAYPEGSTYWGYGTSFTVLTAAMFESAFDRDFGLAEYPAFKESADFRLLSVAPSGWYYNYADCGDKRGENGDLTLAWFATKTGNKIYFERERFLKDPEEIGRMRRHGGAALVWLSQFEAEKEEPLPLAWKADGHNPIVIFRGGEDDPRQYYFGGKGGRGTVNHGNMDAGSFIFELNGVRWVVDPGNQSYHELEKTGFNLWGSCQDCERWTLLTKNNYGHSTLTVNNALHNVDGFASITGFEKGSTPEATIDMTDVFEGKLKSATRRFIKDSPRSLLIEDQIELSEDSELITWQLMTTADVMPVDGGALLRQDGKQLKLDILTPEDVDISVVTLDPPPMKLDRQIEDLKRIEIRVPAWILEDNEGEIRVRLTGE